MNCPKCGFPVEAGARFCTNCGASILQEESAPSGPAWPPFTGQSDPGQPFNAPPGAQPVSTSPAWQGVRKTLSSTPFLLVAIFLSVNLVITFFGIFGSSGSYSGSMILEALLTCLPILLYTIGAWLLYSSSRGSAPLKGCGLIRAASIILTVLICMAMAGLVIVFIPVLTILSEGKRISGSTGYRELVKLFDGSFSTGIIVFVVSILLLVLVMLYYIKVSSLAKTIQEIDFTGIQRRPISSYLNFAHVIMMVFLFISIIIVLAFVSTLRRYLNPLGVGLSSITSILVLLVNLGLLFSLFVSIRSLKHNLRQ